MPYHNEASVVRLGRTGLFAQTTGLSQSTAHILKLRGHSGREGKRTTLIDKALETALTTEVLWGIVMSSNPSTTTAALALKIGTSSLNQFYTVSLQRTPLAAEMGERPPEFDIRHRRERLMRPITNLLSWADWVPPLS